MQNNISKVLAREINNSHQKVFLCVGTNKCIGDSLGPRVGQILSQKIKRNNVYVFGNLEQNVTYNNINIILEEIYSKIVNPYLIIIDSALSDSRYIGNVIINKKSMIIGSGLNKKDYKLGNISIKGIVGEDNKDNIMNFNNLNNISETLVKNLSDNISKQIIKLL